MPLVYYPDCGREKALPVYVTGVALEYLQEPVSRPTLTDPQLLLSLRGTGVVTVGEKTFELPAGTGFFLNRGVDYHYRSADSGEWMVDWVTFGINGEGINRVLFTGQEFVRLTPTQPEQLKKAFRQIFDAVSLDRESGGLTASAVLYGMLIDCSRGMTEVPQPAMERNAAVQAVLDYIEEHYAEEITLEELCRAAGGFSEQYLCRLFKNSTGQRPIEYILRKRIDMARSFLDKTDLAISDIALRCGFHNTSYFYRNFKKFTGTSPLSYRSAALVE